MNTSKTPAATVLGITFLTFLATLLAGCGGITSGKAAAENGVAQFHAQYNLGKIDDIWDQADPQFRTSTPKQKYDDLMEAIQRKLGKVTSTSNSNWRVQSFNLKTTVLMAQTTTFEHGQGTESFAFVIQGTNAVLAGYNIQSMDLITK